MTQSSLSQLSPCVIMKLRCGLVVTEERRYRGWCSVSRHIQPWWKWSHKTHLCCPLAVCRSCTLAFGRCLQALVLSLCISMSSMLSYIRLTLRLLLTWPHIITALVYLPVLFLVGILYLSPFASLSVCICCHEVCELANYGLEKSLNFWKWSGYSANCKFTSCSTINNDLKGFTVSNMDTPVFNNVTTKWEWWCH